jgi:hypothetical protein
MTRAQELQPAALGASPPAADEGQQPAAAAPRAADAAVDALSAQAVQPVSGDAAEPAAEQAVAAVAQLSAADAVTGEPCASQHEQSCTDTALISFMPVRRAGKRITDEETAPRLRLVLNTADMQVSLIVQYFLKSASNCNTSTQTHTVLGCCNAGGARRDAASMVRCLADNDREDGPRAGGRRDGGGCGISQGLCQKAGKLSEHRPQQDSACLAIASLSAVNT